MAAGVHVPSYWGITPAFTQRRSVPGDTPARAATSLSDGPLTKYPRKKLAAGSLQGSRRLRAERPAASACGARPEAGGASRTANRPLSGLLPVLCAYLYSDALGLSTSPPQLRNDSYLTPSGAGTRP